MKNRLETVWAIHAYAAKPPYRPGGAFVGSRLLHELTGVSSSGFASGSWSREMYEALLSIGMEASLSVGEALLRDTLVLYVR